MAKFDLEQAAAVAAIHQLVAEWAHEVDAHYGQSIEQAELLTKSCRCKLQDNWIEGRERVAEFYQGLSLSLAPGEELPVIRQLVANIRVSLVDLASAKVAFTLLLFAKQGTVPFSDYCEPVEVADVRMDCLCEEDGEWRIDLLDSDRIFRRN